MVIMTAKVPKRRLLLIVLLLALPFVPFILLNDWYTERLRKRELSGGTV